MKIISKSQAELKKYSENVYNEKYNNWNLKNSTDIVNGRLDTGKDIIGRTECVMQNVAQNEHEKKTKG